MSNDLITAQIQRYLAYLAQDTTNWQLNLSLSDHYQRLQDWKQAQHHLDEAKRLANQPFHTRQGHLYLNTRHPEQAQISFQLAFAEQESPETRYGLALSLYLQRAFDHTLEILNAETDDACALLRAKTLHQLQRTEEAQTQLELLLTSGLRSEVTGLLALIHFDHQNFEQAECFSTEALEHAPDNREGLLVRLLLKTLREEASTYDLEALLAQQPEESRLWFALGTTWMRQLNIVSAMEAFGHATRIHPGFYEGWISMGWCYLLQDDLVLAKKAYKQALELDADLADAWGGLALVNALLDNADADMYLQKAFALDADCFLAGIARDILAKSNDSDYVVGQLHALVSKKNTRIIKAV